MTCQTFISVAKLEEYKALGYAAIMSRPLSNFLLLLLATSIWGMGFVATRWTLNDFDPVWSNSLRYIFSALIALPYLLYHRSISWTKSRAPLICAALLLLGLQLQTIGIAHTTLAKSGFLTIFYAIFTPLLTSLFFKQRLGLSYWLLLMLAMLGIALLCDLQFSSFNYGDMITLASAFIFSLHILAIDHFAQEVNPIEFNLQQCFYMGILGLVSGLLFGKQCHLSSLYLQSFTWQGPLTGFIILSIFSSILAFTFQIKAQKALPPHIVSLTFLMESIFATLFGYLFFAETISKLAVIGIVLVISSVALLPLTHSYEKKEK